jgi:hypothetical protein
MPRRARQCSDAFDPFGYLWAEIGKMGNVKTEGMRTTTKMAGDGHEPSLTDELQPIAAKTKEAEEDVRMRFRAA